MDRWHRLILTTGLLLIGHTQAFAVTLLDVTRKTLATNPDLLSSQANRQARYDAIRQAEAGYYPQVAIRAAGGRELSANPNT
ncbi:MAG: TolC family protein, partial [Pseudomonadota bacterium]|nr:TolC family protein [Pseudomonadota bacterium]